MTRRNAYGELTEAQWRAVVVELAETYGWRCYYVENSTREITRRTGPHKGTLVRVRNINRRGQGFPDLVMVRRRDARILFAELKRDRGPRGGGVHEHVEPTDEQKAWLADLGAIARTFHLLEPRLWYDRFDVRLWRPSDYDEVETTLR